jgi:hypothetical protein
LLAALPLVGWTADTTPGEILRQPEVFDGKMVSLAGTITNLRPRVSQRGNAYYTFDLSAGDSAIRVFSFGQPPCRTGASVVVRGQFDRVKRVGRYIFHNEVEAATVECR